jgi:hypothetical protein
MNRPGRAEAASGAFEVFSSLGIGSGSRMFACLERNGKRCGRGVRAWMCARAGVKWQVCIAAQPGRWMSAELW